MSSTRIRGLSYTADEDIQLCQIYLDISQCPINGINQKKDKLWERISITYNEGKIEKRVRTPLSLQSRFSDLCYPISKFRGHVRQIEYQNPSGASESYILKKAKEALLDDVTYTKKKFQFDHVWPLLKDAEKWLDNDEDEQEYINDEIASLGRPMGTKATKMKRKANDEKKKIADKIIADNQTIKELLEKSLLDRTSLASKIEQYTSNKLEIQRQRDENKIMLTSLDSITDPVDREFLKMRKAEVMQRRARESHIQESSPTAFDYGNCSNLNQFQGGCQVTLDSINFDSPLQNLSGFGGSHDVDLPEY